jgi:tetratricopeptide (TPR) repeat protein
VKKNTPENFESMQGALAALTKACEQGSDPKSDLVDFATKLEVARFCQAAPLGNLIDRHQALRESIKQLQQKDPKSLNKEDLLVLQSVGTAYAQMGAWALGQAAVEKIVTVRVPPYLPGADAWLACAYHEYVRQACTGTSPIDLGSEDFFKGIEPILQTGRDLVAQAEANDFKAFGTSEGNISYYRSSLYATLGDIITILAEYSRDTADRDQRLQEGQKYLDLCLRISDQPLIRNSLADVSRQLGRYSEAHQKLDEAFRVSPVPDPVLYHTRATIFWDQGMPLQGLYAIQQYDQSRVEDKATQNAEQYVDNQILAAKLAAAAGDSARRNQYVALAADILESARAFLDKRSALLEASVQDLRNQIDELLGFAYLQLPGCESRAADAFDRLCLPAGFKPATEVSWRQRLGRAKALTRLARSQRRNSSVQAAVQYCDRANEQLVNSQDTVKQFSIESTVPIARRRRRALLYLDTAVAIQELAEENFCEGKLKSSKDLLDQGGAIFAALHDALGLDISLCRELELADLLNTVSNRLRLLQAQQCFLSGRIALRLDPSFNDGGLVDRVEGIFSAARGVDSDLDCRIDLEFGELLLAAALAKKGDVKMLYRRSLMMLESAAGRDVPLLRPEALRALADAYARNGAVSRIASESSKSA